MKPDIGSVSRFLPTPPAFDAPVRGSPSEYRHAVWCGKTRMVGLPDGENFEDMCNRLDSDTISACDRQTDRRTSCDGIVRAMNTCRAVIIQKFTVRWKQVAVAPLPPYPKYATGSSKLNAMESNADFGYTADVYEFYSLHPRRVVYRTF